MYDYQADIRNPLRTHTVILYRYLLPIAILVNNAFKTVQQSAKDKEDICRRADARQRYPTQDFTLGWAGLRCIILQDCYKIIFKCIHLYNIRNCFSVLYFLRPLHITEKENFTEIFH